MAADDDETASSFFVVILVSVAVYAVSFVLMQALSRYREFAADRGAAVITGRPSALASALVKIDGDDEARAPAGPAGGAPARWPPSTSSPRSSSAASADLFSTHPPLEQRLAALGRLETQLQRGGR